MTPNESSDGVVRSLPAQRASAEQAVAETERRIAEHVAALDEAIARGTVAELARRTPTVAEQADALGREITPPGSK